MLIAEIQSDFISLVMLVKKPFITKCIFLRNLHYGHEPTCFFIWILPSAAMVCHGNQSVVNVFPLKWSLLIMVTCRARALPSLRPRYLLSANRCFQSITWQISSAATSRKKYYFIVYINEIYPRRATMNIEDSHWVSATCILMKW